MGEQNKPHEGKPMMAEEMFNEWSLFMGDGTQTKVVYKGNYITSLEEYAAQQTAALREELEVEKAAFKLSKGMLDSKIRELEAVKKERAELQKLLNEKK